MALALEVGSEDATQSVTGDKGESAWKRLPRLFSNPVVNTWMLMAVVIVIASKVVR